MKFRVQICFVIFLIAIVDPTVLAQTSAEKDSRALHVASLLIPRTDSTGAGGLDNPAANANPSASKERQPAAVEVQNSLRAGIASLEAGSYKDAKASFEAARQLARTQVSCIHGSATPTLAWMITKIQSKLTSAQCYWAQPHLRLEELSESAI